MSDKCVAWHIVQIALGGWIEVHVDLTDFIELIGPSSYVGAPPGYSRKATTFIYIHDMAIRHLGPRLARLPLCRNLQTAASGATLRVPEFAFAFE